MSKEEANTASLRELTERLETLETQLFQQTRRIHELERRLGLWRAPASASPVAASSSQGRFVARLKSVNLTALRGVDWERLIGGNWFNRVGILAIILAVGLFLRYAFENQWLGPRGRVLVGAGVGFALLLFSIQVRRRDFQLYANGLAGGGICILYLSVYAASDRYQLLGQATGMGLMALVTTMAVLLAVRYDALTIAVLGLIGGFLTPVLLKSEVDRQSTFFGYLILLNLGIAGIAWFKRWRLLNYLAEVATFLLSLAWWLEWYQPQRMFPTLLYLTALFLIFALTGLIQQLVRNEPAREPELVLILVNATLYFAALHTLLEAEYSNWQSRAALILAGFYILQAYLVRSRSRSDRYLEIALNGLAAVFVTVAVPLYFSLSAVTIGWAAEGVALIWLGLRRGRRSTRLGAVLVLALAAGHWLLVDLPELSPVLGDRFLIAFNWRGLPVAVTIVALLLGARQYRRSVGVVTDREQSVQSGALGLAATILLVIWVSLDLWDYYRLLQEPYRGTGWNQGEIQRLQQISRFLVGTWWAWAGAAVVTVGVRRPARVARFVGGVWLLMAGMMSANNGFSGSIGGQPTLFNTNFGLNVTLAVGLAVAYRQYRHPTASIHRIEGAILPRLLLVGANLSLLGGLSQEIDSFLARHPSFSGGEVVGQAAQSVLSATYGAALITIGAWSSNQQIRRLGLLVIGLTIIKVFFLDLAALDQVYRIVSFIALGIVLLLVSWQYRQRN